MHSIVDAKVLEGYAIEVTFEDNKRKIIDLSNRLWGEVFEPLKDPAYFKKMYVDPELGTICWPNGADQCPDVLYEEGSDLPPRL